MWTGDSWPDRNHVHFRIRFFEQTTFQARVDNLDVRRFVEQTLIGFTYQMHHRRISVRLPARICAFRFGFRASQFTQRIQHAHHVVFTAVDQRTDQTVNFYVIISHGHHTDVQGGFDHTFCHV
ncbi:Uncharacterised protein [Shigella sonnei]|nr:Uncharacterised protein [Shigella sonnei]